jgi:hypothetical protein
MDLDSFLVSLYVLIEDWWKLDRSSKPPKTARPALLSDPEVLTLAILAQWPRFRSERDFWRFASSHLRSYFPTPSVLPESVQPAGTGPGARAAHRAARIRPRARLSFGSLPRRGHHPHPGEVRVRASRKGLFSVDRLPSDAAPPRPSGSTASRWLWW